MILDAFEGGDKTKNNTWYDRNKYKMSKVGIVMVCLSAFVVWTSICMPTASADSVTDAANAFSSQSALIAFVFIGLPFGVVGLVLILVGGDAKKYGIISGAIGAVFLLLALCSVIVGAMVSSTGSCPDGYVWNGSTCVKKVVPPGSYVADWEGYFHNPYWGTAHDANTEYPDILEANPQDGVNSPFTACGSVSPAGTDVGGDSTKYYTDNTSKHFTLRIDIDDEAANTVAGYIDPDCANIDMHMFLQNPTPAVGGGNQEIPFWGRISVSRTVGTMNNGSYQVRANPVLRVYADVFYSDLNAGVYLGFGVLADSGTAAHTSDHTYRSYINEIMSPGPHPKVGDWIPLGTSDGDVDGEWVSVWWILDLGLADYNTPPDGTEVTLKVEIGTNPESTDYQGDLVEFQFSLVIVRDA